jgi:hypothetical protein
MAGLKQKGDLAEAMVAADILRRGHKIAFPFGEDWDYDLIACRDGRLERVQVKHAVQQDGVVPVRCCSMSLTNGRVRVVKRYTSATIDWIAVYEANTGRCYYVPSSEFRDGRRLLSLRLSPPRNCQQRGIRWARDYLAF